MIFFKIMGLCVMIVIKSCVGDGHACVKKPLGAKTAPLPPDNQFTLDIMDIRDDSYIPGREYLVRLHSRNPKSTFIAFTISLQEDTEYNVLNPRKPRYLQAGTLSPGSDSKSQQVSRNCTQTLVESDITAKTSVEAIWTAPPKNNKCVTIFAVVAEKPDVWYDYGYPLSKRVCEDPRKDDDIMPMEVDNCEVCEEARFQLVFEGLWSFNTHPNMFPNPHELARFSDVVGATHDSDLTIFKFNSEASLGLKMLAEQGNTTTFEIEIQSNLGTQVRSVIKATAPDRTDSSTKTSFRATRTHHRLSLATGILPSPDWFLGVSHLELCAGAEWSKNVRLNLYPIDSGTDSGLDFQSPNEGTSPPQPIAPAAIGNSTKGATKPFARLNIQLTRTYTTPKCTSQTTQEPPTQPTTQEPGEEVTKITEVTEPGGDGASGQNPSIFETTTPGEEPTEPPQGSENCPMSPWSDWLPCSGRCVQGAIQGQRTRLRDHIPIAASDDSVPTITKYCTENYSSYETKDCSEPCEENREIIEEE